MRSIAIPQQDTVIFGGLLGLLFVLLLLLQFPVRPHMWVYPFVRQAALVKIDYQSRAMLTLATEHFLIKYTAADENMAPLVAAAAEQAYGPVTSVMGYRPVGVPLIVIYPSKAELKKAFGWSGKESAMGVYWGGVIQLLSPRIWLGEEASLQEFIYAGPMVHELTHLVFDYMTNGNYPRWFTEGLAQYVEYRVTGYQWLTGENQLNRHLYTLKQLDEDFDNLDNQGLAYRESLAAVRYLADVYGEDKLRNVVGALRAGENIQAAIRETAGLSYTEYESAWKKWAAAAMEKKEPLDNRK